MKEAISNNLLTIRRNKEMTEERKQAILMWKKNPSYKEDSMAGRILLNLSDHGLTRYRFLVENERSNYARNLGNFKEDLRICERGLKSIIENVELYLGSRFPKANYNDVRLVFKKKSNRSIGYDIYRYSESKKIQELPTGHRWGTLEEHKKVSKRDHLSDVRRRKKEIQSLKERIKEIELRPGIYFKGSYPAEPNYSQLVVTMVVLGTIKRVSHGQYRITMKGINILRRRNKS